MTNDGSPPPVEIRTGALLVDKPAGPTSHDVVQAIRKLTGIKKIGHAGTLDPFATGLLPVLVGRATRLSSHLTFSEKIYVCVLDLRYATDTHDREGKKTSPLFTSFPSEDEMEKHLNSLTGERPQIPPMFSAKKIKGEKCYRLARQGKEIPRDPVMIEIFRISLLSYEKHHLTLLVHCSSGTYIRALAHEIGENFGGGAHLSCLRRVATGGFHLRDAVSLKALQRAAEAGSVWDRLIPPEDMLSDYPRLMVNEGGEKKFRHGNALAQPDVLESSAPEKEGPPRLVRVFNTQKLLLGLARHVPGEHPDSGGGARYQPAVVLRPET